MALEPYRSTPVFNERSLPEALRREHRTKAGVWGVLRVLEGEVIYTVTDPPGERRVTKDCPVIIEPQQPHHVTPLGQVRLQVDFYNSRPDPLGETGE